MRIREAALGDAETIARVHVESWRTTYSGIIPDDHLAQLSYERRAQMWHNNVAKRTEQECIYVAEDENGEVVGFAAGGPERAGDPLYRGEIYAIYMLKKFQRRGIGRQLSVAIVRRLLQAGVESMIIWVLAKNPSRGFYEALGGELLSEKAIAVGDAKLIEVAYGWKDLRALLRCEV
ncbi:MAG TPA: GNAT family N-acetyltransferase [Candidatus Binatia bacterium]|jgi:GNAT superfamily N-acetyltransferase